MGKNNKSSANDGIKIITKPSFGTPFSVTWPEIGKHENQRIIEEIKREIPKCIDGRKLLKQQKKDGHKSREISKSLEKRLSYRNCLLLGINAVTKALESGPLSLVLVCKSVKPVSMTHHLIPLCAMRGTAGCCVAGLNAAVAPALGMKSVLAVGFKIKPENPLSDLIAFIQDKAPSLDVPWMKIWKDDSNILRTTEEPTARKRAREIGAEETLMDKIKCSQLVTEERRQEIVEETLTDTYVERTELESNPDVEGGRKPNKRKHSRSSEGNEKLSKLTSTDVAYKLIDANYQMFDVKVKKK